MIGCKCYARSLTVSAMLGHWLSLLCEVIDCHCIYTLEHGSVTSCQVWKRMSAVMQGRSCSLHATHQWHWQLVSFCQPLTGYDSWNSPGPATATYRPFLTSVQALCSTSKSKPFQLNVHIHESITIVELFHHPSRWMPPIVAILIFRPQHAKDNFRRSPR